MDIVAAAHPRLVRPLTQPSLAGFLASLTAGAALPPLTAAAWELLGRELLTHDLAPFAYARLRATAAWGEIPPGARAALSAAFQASSVRTYFLENELAHVVASLAAADIPVMLLKGAALGRLVYDSPAERPINDFDLLTPPGQVDAALRILAARGYEAQGLFWLSAWQRRYRAEAPLICRTPERWRLLIELHWTLVELPYYIDAIPIADIWATAMPAPGLPGAYVPDPATLLLHSCAHVAFHHSTDARLLWLLDVDRLARRAALDWDMVLTRAAAWGLTTVLAGRLASAQAQLDTPIPPAVTQRLQKAPRQPWEQRMIGLGDEKPGRVWRRAWVCWQAFGGRQRVRYAAWLGLRSLLWLPETVVRRRQQRAAARFAPVRPSYG